MFVIKTQNSQRHAHHVFPQGHQKYFLEAGINIHDPKYLSWRSASPHLKNAKSYNAKWLEFREVYPNAPADQILQRGKEIMSECGVPINF